MSKRAVAAGPAAGLLVAAGVTFIAFPSSGGAASAETPAPTTIEQLLSQAWEIAGYTSAADNRASLILFRHPGVNSLVQCSVHYDPTRKPLAVVNCYELR
jgi:hypothetical protein